MVAQVAQRVCAFELARPAREVPFTAVPREDRYKAKTFVDTVFHRSSDQGEDRISKFSPRASRQEDSASHTPFDLAQVDAVLAGSRQPAVTNDAVDCVATFDVPLRPRTVVLRALDLTGGAD